MRSKRNLHYTVTSNDTGVWFSEKRNRFELCPSFGDGCYYSHKYCNTLKSAVKWSEKCAGISPSRKSIMTRWCIRKGKRFVEDFICDKSNA